MAHHRDRGIGRAPLVMLSWGLPLTLPYSPRPQGWVTSGQTTTRKGMQPHPSVDNWIKVLLSKTWPTRARPSFSHCQSLPSRSFHKPLSLTHQSADRGSTVAQKPYYRKLITMKKQKVMSQMKGQDKIPEKQLMKWR